MNLIAQLRCNLIGCLTGVGPADRTGVAELSLFFLQCIHKKHREESIKNFNYLTTVEDSLTQPSRKNK